VQRKLRAISTEFILHSALWLLSLCGLSAVAQEKPAAAPPELLKPAEAMVLALNQKELDKAFSMMTDKGADQYIGMTFLQLAAIGQVGGEGNQNEDLEKLQAMVSGFGLDKVSMDGLMPTGFGDKEKIAERLLRSVEKIQKELLACIPANERRKATQELVELSAKIMVAPASFAIGAFEIEEEKAELQVVAKVLPEMAGQDDGMDGMTLAYLQFVKQGNDWRFDGFNNKRMIEQMLTEGAPMSEPFKEIVDLTIEGNTIAGEAVSLASYKGKVVLVDFWGTWCGPCLAAMPKLTALHEKYQAKGFEILGVAADDSDSLKEFLDKKPLAWKNVTDAESELAMKYSIEAYPTTLLIDKQGKHVATNLHGALLEKAIDMLLEGKSIESITGSAQDILAAAKKRAAEEKKFIFLHFGADWCGPCKLLEEWMAQPEIHAIFQKHFIDVKIDVDNNFGAQELMTSLSPKAGGIPWFCVLNATDDKPLATGEDKDGNAGVPSSAEGFDGFTKMFKATGSLTIEELELIRKSIEQQVERFKASSPE
jgi:thiol-disulfide isomerase/thioredoxin